MAGQRRRTPRLLLPPIFINRLPWTRGYFQNVAYRPIADNDTLEQHYFLDDLRSTILDLDGNDVEEQEVVGPCGSWGLDSYQTVDMYVEQALRKQGQ